MRESAIGKSVVFQGDLKAEEKILLYDVDVETVKHRFSALGIGEFPY